MHGKMGKRRLDWALSAAGSAAETSLQRRNSCMFGGTFGGRKSRPETKLMHFRRPNSLFRRPKVSFSPKSLAFGGKVWQPKLPPQGVRRPNLASAAEPGFSRKAESEHNSCSQPPKSYQTPITCIPTLLHSHITYLMHIEA